MCYNCGCEMPDNDMGKGHAVAEADGKAITNRTFAAVAEAFGSTDEMSKENTLNLLKKSLAK